MSVPVGKCPHPPGFHKPDQPASAQPIVRRGKKVCLTCGHEHLRMWGHCASFVRHTEPGRWLVCGCGSKQHLADPQRRVPLIEEP